MALKENGLVKAGVWQSEMQPRINMAGGTYKIGNCILYVRKCFITD